MRQSRRMKIGDVYEVQTPVGCAYIQLTHVTPDDGFPLVRVLPGVYGAKPDVSTLVKQPELYFAFYVLPYAIREGLARLVSNLPVPSWASPYPVMRKRWSERRSGGFSWLIGPASTPTTPEGISTMRRVEKLSPTEQNLSIFGILSHQALVEQIARGWTPADDVSDSDTPVVSSEGVPGVRHFIYFSHRRDALKSLSDFKKLPCKTNIKKVPDGWLVEITHTSEVLISDTELQQIASQWRGEYDGSEVKIESDSV